MKSEKASIIDLIDYYETGVVLKDKKPQHIISYSDDDECDSGNTFTEEGEDIKKEALGLTDIPSGNPEGSVPYSKRYTYKDQDKQVIEFGGESVVDTDESSPPANIDRIDNEPINIPGDTEAKSFFDFLYLADRKDILKEKDNLGVKMSKENRELNVLATALEQRGHLKQASRVRHLSLVKKAEEKTPAQLMTDLGTSLKKKFKEQTAPRYIVYSVDIPEFPGDDAKINNASVDRDQWNTHHQEDLQVKAFDRVYDLITGAMSVATTSVGGGYKKWHPDQTPQEKADFYTTRLPNALSSVYEPDLVENKAVTHKTLDSPPVASIWSTQLLKLGNETGLDHDFQKKAPFFWNYMKTYFPDEYSAMFTALDTETTTRKEEARVAKGIKGVYSWGKGNTPDTIKHYFSQLNKMQDGELIWFHYVWDKQVRDTRKANGDEPWDHRRENNPVNQGITKTQPHTDDWKKWYRKEKQETDAQARERMKKEGFSFYDGLTVKLGQTVDAGTDEDGQDDQDTGKLTGQPPGDGDLAASTYKQHTNGNFYAANKSKKVKVFTTAKAAKAWAEKGTSTGGGGGGGGRTRTSAKDKMKKASGGLIKDQKTGDQFREWVNAKPERLKKTPNVWTAARAAKDSKATWYNSTMRSAVAKHKSDPEFKQAFAPKESKDQGLKTGIDPAMLKAYLAEKLPAREDGTPNAQDAMKNRWGQRFSQATIAETRGGKDEAKKEKLERALTLLTEKGTDTYNFVSGLYSQDMKAHPDLAFRFREIADQLKRDQAKRDADAKRLDAAKKSGSAVNISNFYLVPAKPQVDKDNNPPVGTLFVSKQDGEVYYIGQRDEKSPKQLYSLSLRARGRGNVSGTNHLTDDEIDQVLAQIPEGEERDLWEDYFDQEGQYIDSLTESQSNWNPASWFRDSRDTERTNWLNARKRLQARWNQRQEDAARLLNQRGEKRQMMERTM
mgnify:CR=1 FL=1